jgi:LmbE family N-acetylglucosaminyl deacetylase
MPAHPEKAVLALFAHPDDAEFMCTGTLALLRQKAWNIHIATVTAGDCGSVEYDRRETGRIRRAEAAKSAAILDGGYHCLECDDMFVMYDRATLLKAVELMREVRPRIVFTTSPSDYAIDHETTSRIAQTACFGGGIPNIEIDGAEVFEPIPYLYYVDAIEGKDIFGTEIKPKVLVDISSVMDTKERMLCCHESQRSWLMAHHGIDQYVMLMKEFARKRGKLIGADYAEGFRQHLGSSFPQDDILKSEMKDLVHNI